MRLATLAHQVTRAGGGDIWIAGLIDQVVRDPFGAAFATCGAIANAPSAAAVAFPGRLVRPRTP